jgi:hypothetical protein
MELINLKDFFFLNKNKHKGNVFNFYFWTNLIFFQIPVHPRIQIVFDILIDEELVSVVKIGVDSFISNGGMCIKLLK